MRRLLIVLLAVPVVAAGASLLAWHWAVGQMETRIAVWEAEQRAQGWTVSHGPPERGGWPLAAEVTLPGLSLDGGAGDVPGGITWSAERVTLRVAVARSRLATVSMAGVQHLRLGPAAPVSYTAERCTVAVALDASAPPSMFDLDAGGIKVAGGPSIGLLQGQFDVRDPAAAKFHLTSEAIGFPPPPAPQPPLGGGIASVSLDGVWQGGWPQATDPAASAAAWQAAGGAVTVQRLALGWGPLGVSGSGTVSLDSALQPVGTAKLRIVGYEATLSALAAGHVLAARAAQAAQAVLGLIATTPEGGGAPVVEVPLTLHGGALTMGRIPLARVPLLAWPSGTQPATLSQ
jgi:hypothetical protein